MGITDRAIHRHLALNPTALSEHIDYATLEVLHDDVWERIGVMHPN